MIKSHWEKLSYYKSNTCKFVIRYIVDICYIIKFIWKTCRERDYFINSCLFDYFLKQRQRDFKLNESDIYKT